MRKARAALAKAEARAADAQRKAAAKDPPLKITQVCPRRMSIVCGMATIEVDEDRFTAMLAELKPHLDERQWRLTLGARARALGRGGAGSAGWQL